MFRSRNDHLDALLALICEELQLPPSSYNIAEQRYLAVGAWLEGTGSPLRRYGPTIYPQGSFRIGTTVRPLSGDEFDLDLVCNLDLGVNHVSPLVILNAVEQRLRQHGDYARMIERKRRCVRLTYANEFHLDVLPARPSWPPQGTQLLIPDRELMTWLKSNPKGYAEWFEGRSKTFFTEMRKRVEPLPDHENADEKNSLQRAVQLLKRWRDVRYEKSVDVAPRSIVLTTLAGLFFTGTPSTSNEFGEIVGAVARQIAQNVIPLRVVNPAQASEVLSEQWERQPHTYRLFGTQIAQLHDRWVTIQQSAKTEAVASELSALFGEQVTNRAFKRLTAEHIEPRRTGRTIGVSRSSGALSIAPLAGIISIRRNTFYGEE